MTHFPSISLLCALVCFHASAAEISVKPDTSGKALAQAIATANAGDTLILAPGVYHERIRIEKPLTLRGKPGAILDGTTPLKSRMVTRSRNGKGLHHPNQKPPPRPPGQRQVHR